MALSRLSTQRTWSPWQNVTLMTVVSWQQTPLCSSEKMVRPSFLKVACRANLKKIESVRDFYVC